MEKSKVKLLILDVDGTLTNGKVYIAETGELFKAFDIKDGFGIHDILPAHGIQAAIITGRKSKMLEIRSKEIGIKYLFQGIGDKVGVLEQLLEELKLKSFECAYMGDDINDLECMKKVGIIGCPSDAVRQVKEIAHFTSERNGGDGAVREFIEWLCN